MRAQYYTLPLRPKMVPGGVVYECNENNVPIGFIHRVDERCHIILFQARELLPSVIANGAVVVKEELTAEEYEDFVSQTEYLRPGFSAGLDRLRKHHEPQ